MDPFGIGRIGAPPPNPEPIDGIAEDPRPAGVVAGEGAAVARAHARLAEIVAGFEARAEALEPFLDSPEAAAALRAEA
ncbi:hypothetical protein BST36_30810, partial [Mycolicibacterium moriokaense]